MFTGNVLEGPLVVHTRLLVAKTRGWEQSQSVCQGGKDQFRPRNDFIRFQAGYLGRKLRHVLQDPGLHGREP